MKNFDNKQLFLENSQIALDAIWESLSTKENFYVRSLNPFRSAYIIVDMVNGFTREGALQSERICKIIDPIVKGMKMMDSLHIPKVAFADHHTDISPEFSAYPPHCLVGTSEVEIVDEIQQAGGYTLIPKNSTNGFLEPAFMDWLEKYSDVENFIVTGDCTDICVQQFAVSLKTRFDRMNKKVNIIVPMNLVETYDFGLHNGDLLHVMGLYMMELNGIQLVKSLI